MALHLSDHEEDSRMRDYRFEKNRLQSFEGWTYLHISPTSLAAAGFYWTKQLDRVRCFECATEICRWEEGDDPVTEHQRWSGRCRFVRQQPCGNVPMGVDPATIPQYHARSKDVCGLYGVQIRPKAEADKHATTSGSAKPTLPLEQIKVNATSEQIRMEKIDSTSICRICCDGKLAMMFLPCGHLIACIKCAQKLDLCAVCRKAIEQRVRAFLA